MNIPFLMFLAAAALGLISLIAFLVLRVKFGGLRGLVSKTVTSVFFIITAVCAFAANPVTEAAFPYFVLIGLVLGLLGDIYLDLKWVYPKDNDAHTFTGFIFFALEHLFIITGLMITYADFSRVWYIVVPLIVALALAVGVVVMEKPMKLEYGRFKAITSVYSGILGLSTALCCSFAIMNGFASMTLNFMGLGMILFLISDLILSGTYFGEGKDRPVDIVLNHGTYYLGQFLIAASIFFLI